MPSRALVLSHARQIVATHRRLLAEARNHRKYGVVFEKSLLRPFPVLIRNAVYLFVHHISALLVLFVHAVADCAAKAAMRAELVRSADAFAQVLSSDGEHLLVARRAAKSFFIVRELIRVS